jgi:leucyl aminopeptidase
MTLSAVSDRKSGGVPVYCVEQADNPALPPDLGETAKKWISNTGFDGSAGSLCLIPNDDGTIAAALYGLGKEPSAMETGKLPRLLPAGDWQLAGDKQNSELAVLGWLLGAYRFEHYRTASDKKVRLVLPDTAMLKSVERTARAIYLVRDLINTPANDLGPEELEQVVRQLGKTHGAPVNAIRGEDLLEKNFPMVHAVGRASAQAPRIVELSWGQASHPAITLVGKGVCFDTGGLNIKPGDSMSLMKKDMGGAANVIGLASMIMTAGLPVRLRLIIGAVENAISANAFRPGDILPSRKGITVEIGNTDAEGRLVLGDALAYGDEDSPELLIDMATLTGAARVALGPDLPAMFTPDDNFAAELSAASSKVEDPHWRMPLWTPYARNLSSKTADISHISKGPFGGAITAALFLQRFVEKTRCWAHFDIFGWVNNEKPWATIGGEAYSIRALYEVIAARYPPG